jgi:hypothetical protein
MVVVRSMDNPAIDMNNPEEPFNLLSYVNREQYGDRPLLYGPYFNAPPIDIKEGRTMYRKDSNTYTDIGRKQDYEFDKSYYTLFPRMGDRDKETSEQGYRSWGNMTEITSQLDYAEQKLSQAQTDKEREEIRAEIEELKLRKPKMSNNLAYLFRYQLGHMYWRYFMWNFAGRQNDQQGHDFNHNIDGNWISGIKFVDAMRLGPQTDLPVYLENNLARNKYYFIPLILGILGLVFHFKRGKNDAIVTSVLFVFTGALIIIFLNQPPYEPRERDYSLVGSFQTFCVWIGLGVLFIWSKLKDRMNGLTAGILATVIALSAPFLMAQQGWDDHDRSDRYLGIDFAKNYLMSCPQNAVLFTNGDNDTYPLWYAQNVEGIRTDVRIINWSLLPTDWYSQILLTKVYNSEPLPLSLTKQQLASGINDYFQFQQGKDYAPKDLRTVIKELTSGKSPYFSNKKFRVPVDKKAALASGVVSLSDSASIANEIIIDFPGRGLNKGDLVLLDLIATNAERGWKRPICFTTTSGSDGFLNMEAYFERRGLIYQLIPVRSNASRGNVSRVNEEVLYDNLMNKYQYSGINKKKNFYLDDKATIVPNALQNLFISLSGHYLSKIQELKMFDSALQMPGNKEKADAYKTKIANLMNKCAEVLPENVLVTKGQTKYNMALIWHEAGNDKKAEEHLTQLYDLSMSELRYYMKFGSRKTYYMRGLAKDAFDMMERCAATASEWKSETLKAKWERSNKELESAVANYVNNE